jgi:cysteine desulfurase
MGWESSRAVAAASVQIAALIGADADEIIFTSGATEANNLALQGLAGRRPGKRRRILMSAIEHKSVLATTNVLVNRFGCQVETLPVDSEGRVAVAVLEAALDETVLAVSIMAVNNEIGTIQDIRGLSSATREAGAVFHCDAAQMPLAQSSDGLARVSDLASLSAHKMYGPAGIGVLYVRRDLQQQIEPVIHGGGQQNGLRSGTIPLPLCVGMGAAAEMLLGDQIGEARVTLGGLRDKFVEMLGRLPWTIKLNGPTIDHRHPGNANVCFPGFLAHDILSVLQPTVAASTGSACSSGIPGPSHVLRAIGLSGDDAEASIRFSFGFATNEAEIVEAVALIAGALERLSETTTTCSAGTR